MKIEDYFKYYIQGSDHYLIPKDVFKELFNEMINWKEESKKQKKVIDETRHYVEKECNDLLIGYFHNRFDTTEYYEKLLQILDKGESNE